MTDRDTLSDNDEYLSWGWERFFTELTFLHTVERQRKTSNEAYILRVCAAAFADIIAEFVCTDGPLAYCVHVNNQQAVVCAHYYLNWLSVFESLPYSGNVMLMNTL